MPKIFHPSIGEMVWIYTTRKGQLAQEYNWTQHHIVIKAAEGSYMPPLCLSTAEGNRLHRAQENALINYTVMWYYSCQDSPSEMSEGLEVPYLPPRL